jgi:hypothetical protein
MDNSTRTTTVKRSIKPVTFTIVVEAKKVNENGTFSSFEFKSVKGPNKSAKAVSPIMAGGAIYLKVDTLEGITVLTESDAATATKTKLF